MRDGSGSKSTWVLAAIAALLLVALTAVVAPTTASADKCLKCPPPEDEEERPPEEPRVPKLLVVNVGWDTGNPETSAPLNPNFLTYGVNYLRERANPWFKAAAPGFFQEWTVYSGGSYTIPPPSTAGCSGTITYGQPPETFFGELVTSGDAAATAHKFVLGNYDAVIFVWSHRVCRWDGITNGLGGNRIGLPSIVGAARHELGHHLGLPHANALACSNNGSRSMPFVGTCNNAEYGDPFDMMGQREGGFGGAVSEGVFNALYQNNLGWMTGQVVNLNAGNYTQSYTLKPLSEPTQSPRAIRLDDGLTTLWIEYRQPTGADTPESPGLTYGVLIHREVVGEPTELPSSQLLDMSPGTTFEDPGLPVGQTWVNPRGEMKITVNNATSTGATVTIANARVAVPAVKGMPLAEAEAILRAAGLRPTGGGEVIDPTCQYLGVVATQNPFAGNRVLPETAVSLSVGMKDPDPLFHCQ